MLDTAIVAGIDRDSPWVRTKEIRPSVEVEVRADKGENEVEVEVEVEVLVSMLVLYINRDDA
jgi:hypothetical protein